MPPSVIGVGPSICGNSNGVHFKMGIDGEGHDVHHSDPSCPSFITYASGHNGKADKTGFNATADSLEPHIRQNFTCIEDIFVELCSSSSSSPTSGGSTSYVEAECDKLDVERASTSMLGGIL
ncbi:MAG: hypothetical protein AAFZ65_04720 [Planctomycetota bacterium]